MQPVTPPHRDPAPSRTAYRIHRLWLTPMFRTMLRVGLPVLGVAALVGGYLSDPAHIDALRAKSAEIKRSVQERPEFMVKLMAIDGASDDIAQDIREIVPVDFPISSFDLDLPGMQDRIQELDAVARADLRIRPGGILQVRVRERVPAVVWRNGQGLDLLDADGNRVSPIAMRSDRPDLPLLAGEGAEDAVPEALEILATAGPVARRVRGLVRMGERRWTLVLDRDQSILLPEAHPIEALEQVMALQQAQDLLVRDVMIVDMRNENRPTVRMAEPAVEELRRIRGLGPGAGDE